jgi:hypothetical protein
MLGEDVNGDFLVFEIDLVELDRLFLKRALGEDKARSLTSSERKFDGLDAERKLTDKSTEPPQTR